MDEVVTEEKELTWEDIYHDFHEHCPNVASLVDDYRPYAQNMIQIWTKTHVTLTYNYLTKRDAMFMIARRTYALMKRNSSSWYNVMINNASRFK